MSKKVWFDFIFYLILIVIILVVLPHFYCFASVSGKSMYPTLKHNDYLFVSKVSKINSGDIIIIKREASDDFLVKRVIGVSKDKLEFSSRGISVNGTLLDEQYLNTGEEVTYKDYVKVVNEDSYYVLGDNRNHSTDSRIFGDVKSSDVVGVVKFNLSSIGLSQSRIRVILVILMIIFILYRPSKVR